MTGAFIANGDALVTPLRKPLPVIEGRETADEFANRIGVSPDA
jgi:hypothetical protein